MEHVNIEPISSVRTLKLQHVSGGAFNPAVAIAVAVLGLANGANLWIYWLGEFLGAGVAAVFFLVVNGKRLPEPSVAAHARGQEPTHQSIRAA